MVKRKINQIMSESNDEIKKKSNKNISTKDINEGNTSQYFNSIERISHQFLSKLSCIETAKALLGQTLCRRVSPDGPVLKGRIVETESYLGAEDEASYSFNGRRTDRNEPMYMKCGTCFVYMTYGMYYCLNISTQGSGQAVLLRAIQPLEGIEFMQQMRVKSRKKVDSDAKPLKLKMLCNGPSKLCMAFDININNTNKVDITDSSDIWIESGDVVSEAEMVSTKRIGITRAGIWNDKPLRFYIKQSEFISKK